LAKTVLVGGLVRVGCRRYAGYAAHIGFLFNVRFNEHLAVTPLTPELVSETGICLLHLKPPSISVWRRGSTHVGWLTSDHTSIGGLCFTNWNPHQQREIHCKHRQLRLWHWGSLELIAYMRASSDETFRASSNGRVAAAKQRLGSRWAVETLFSGLKCTMGSMLTSRKPSQLPAEAAFRVLAYSLRR
jgi:hypothetical protein